MKSLPLVRKLDLPADPIFLFERLVGKKHPFLLDSGLLIEGLGRYSFMGKDPFLIFRSKDHVVELESGGGRLSLRSNPLVELRRLLNMFRLAPQDFYLPFFGGAVGYFSYDLGRILEELPCLALDDLEMPDICLGFYDVVVAVDHLAGDVYAVSTGLPETCPRGRFERAKERLEEICFELAGPQSPGCHASLQEGFAAEQIKLSCSFEAASYCQAVERIKEYIARGDVFQVNISQRFSVRPAPDPWLLYKRLRGISPAPMAAYLDFGDAQLLSSSPERFLRLKEGFVETRPIKGTRPRGRSVEEDFILREELLNSEKDIAELVMIVDVERNDLGRVCQPGSVRVPELFRLEEYATVFHLVSTIVGELSRGKGIVELLAAAFPGGSITGAPKIRAMEIIEELEPVRRGAYTGSIGYIGFNGDADLNIAIRTIVVRNGQLCFHAGGGVTIDSDPLAEYEETLHKARAMMLALGIDFSLCSRAFEK